jgi:hypothetical protein
MSPLTRMPILICQSDREFLPHPYYEGEELNLVIPSCEKSSIGAHLWGSQLNNRQNFLCEGFCFFVFDVREKPSFEPLSIPRSEKPWKECKGSLSEDKV